MSARTSNASSTAHNIAVGIALEPMLVRGWGQCLPACLRPRPRPRRPPRPTPTNCHHQATTPWNPLGPQSKTGVCSRLPPVSPSAPTTRVAFSPLVITAHCLERSRHGICGQPWILGRRRGGCQSRRFSSPASPATGSGASGLRRTAPLSDPTPPLPPAPPLGCPSFIPPALASTRSGARSRRPSRDFHHYAQPVRPGPGAKAALCVTVA